jgi:hypothetical protein
LFHFYKKKKEKKFLVFHFLEFKKVEKVTNLEYLPVAKVNGVALIFFTAYIDIFLGEFEDGAWVKNGDRGETNVDDKSIELASVGYEAVSIALVGWVRNIRSNKFEPGGGGGEEGLVGDETVEFAVSGQYIEFGRKVSGDEAGGRGGGGNDLLGVVFEYVSTDNGVSGGDNTVVVYNATNKFIEIGRKKVIGSSLVNNYVGGINDELGESTGLVSDIGTVDSYNGFGDDSSINDFGKISSSPASTSGDD